MPLWLQQELMNDNQWLKCRLKNLAVNDPSILFVIYLLFIVYATTAGLQNIHAYVFGLLSFP